MSSAREEFKEFLQRLRPQDDEPYEAFFKRFEAALESLPEEKKRRLQLEAVRCGAETHYLRRLVEEEENWVDIMLEPFSPEQREIIRAEWFEALAAGMSEGQTLREAWTEEDACALLERIAEKHKPARDN